ncbi:MAG TPA: thioredoxin-dependent thiol peroxidase, partial [Vibrio sp.]|nr:thioredoxin-dependent thiol peroxidase [Vibrio sp.]
MNTLTAGVPAPAFSLPDQDGNIVSLGDFKGKKVL